MRTSTNAFSKQLELKALTVLPFAKLKNTRMKKNINPLEAECFYHIFNRGINSQKIFFNDRNYHYFTKLMGSKISSVATVYAYCLLKNHFHILVKVKSEQEIRLMFPQKDTIEVSKIISQQFSNIF